MQPRRSRGGGERPAVKKGPWTPDEDAVVQQHVQEHGPREWSSIQSKDLLPRTGKSCRLRWINKLQPDLKKGCKFTLEEERVVIDLQAQLGNRWAWIATHLPGRTDNDVKNFWSTRQKRLARLLRAPLPRSRRSGKQNCSTCSAPFCEMPEQKPLCLDPCWAMTMHHVGQSSSQEPCTDVKPFQETMVYIGQSSSSSSQEPPADAPLPGLLSLTPCAEFPMHATAEGGSSSAKFPMYAPLEVEQMAPFFGIDEEFWSVFSTRHQSRSRVRFRELSPETLEFFERPLSPPPPSATPTTLL